MRCSPVFSAASCFVVARIAALVLSPVPCQSSGFPASGHFPRHPWCLHLHASALARLLVLGSPPSGVVGNPHIDDPAATVANRVPPHSPPPGTPLPVTSPSHALTITRHSPSPSCVGERCSQHPADEREGKQPEQHPSEDRESHTSDGQHGVPLIQDSCL